MKSYKEKIKDFVGKGGYVAFEHGFICKGAYKNQYVKCVGASDTEIEYFMCANNGMRPTKWKLYIDNLHESEAREIYRDLCEYLEYCHTYA